MSSKHVRTTPTRLASSASATKLKGRAACETHDCYLVASGATTGRFTVVEWRPKLKEAHI